jgi:hypothetical protein
MNSIDQKKLTIVLNTLLAGGLLVLMGLGRISWQEVLAGFALLLVPSAVQKVNP